MSVSQHTSMSRKRKFVYTPGPEDAVDNNDASVVQPDFSESSETDSDGDDDLEKDLLQFDDEQAEILRNVNKMGSVRMSASEYTHMASPNNFSHMS